MKGKQTYVRLVCDRERLLPEEARFTIQDDIKGLGTVVNILLCISEKNENTTPWHAVYYFSKNISPQKNISPCN